MTFSSPLPDIVAPGLAVLFVGINPGLRSAALHHHYAGHGNRFWKLLKDSGLTSEALTYDEDHRLLEYGFGLTNIVDRESRGVGDLTPDDFRRGRATLARKIERLEPRIVAFVGVTVFRAFFDERGPVELGASPRTLGRAGVFILPNPSGRNAHASYDEMLGVYRALAARLT